MTAVVRHGVSQVSRMPQAPPPNSAVWPGTAGESVFEGVRCDGSFYDLLLCMPWAQNPLLGLGRQVRPSAMKKVDVDKDPIYSLSTETTCFED